MTPKTRSLWGLDPTSCPITKPVRNRFTSSLATHRTCSNTIQVFLGFESRFRRRRCQCRRSQSPMHRKSSVGLVSHGRRCHHLPCSTLRSRKTQVTGSSLRRRNLLEKAWNGSRARMTLTNCFDVLLQKSHIFEVSCRNWRLRSSVDNRSRRHLESILNDNSIGTELTSTQS